CITKVKHDDAIRLFKQIISHCKKRDMIFKTVPFITMSENNGHFWRFVRMEYLTGSVKPILFTAKPDLIISHYVVTRQLINRFLFLMCHTVSNINGDTNAYDNC